MTGHRRFEVLAVGNALVDVIAHEPDDFLTRHQLTRGTMAMVDADAAELIYDDMNPGTEVSGGSAANTVVGVASLGGSAAFVGKVRDDQLGKVFAHDLRAAGVHYDTPPAPSGPPTGRCLVVVTPDAERTMNTYLGAAASIAPGDVADELVADASISYLEGYLWDQPEAKEAMVHVARVAHAHRNLVAFTLSDPFCVDRHRAEFVDLLDHVDVLFANEAEIRSLFEVSQFDDALQAVRGRVRVAALTRSEHGSVVVVDGEVHVVDPESVDHVVDLTGAGDLYAAGFLFGFARGLDPVTCGRLGSVAAAEVITHLGARPVRSLRDLAAPVLRRAGA